MVQNMRFRASETGWVAFRNERYKLVWGKTPTLRRRIHKNQIKYLILLDYSFRHIIGISIF